jgi:hypothetical protein
MAALGQTEKNSVRAYVFRFAPKLGHCSMHSAFRFRATNGSAEVSEDMQINIPHGQHPAHG